MEPYLSNWCEEMAALPEGIFTQRTDNEESEEAAEDIRTKLVASLPRCSYLQQYGRQGSKSTKRDSEPDVIVHVKVGRAGRQGQQPAFDVTINACFLVCNHRASLPAGDGHLLLASTCQKRMGKGII